ncbi:MAG: hypothetical protein ACPGVS_11190, partial [Primorskyibacter sp.]
MKSSTGFIGFLLVCAALLLGGLFLQSTSTPSGPDPNVLREQALAEARVATGGAQTLEDILARQRGEPINDSFRRDNTCDPDGAAAMAAQLGTLGGAS